MTISPGSRWKSAVCDTEIVVVKPPSGTAAIECGGVGMLPIAAEKPKGGAVDSAHAGGSLLGKRYGDDATGMELLCTKAGAGSLAIAGRALVMREAKRLPSSD